MEAEDALEVRAAARQLQQGLGLFLRSLVGLDREAVKEASAGFMGSRKLTANQIEFVNLVIDYLTDRGAMDLRRLHESPILHSTRS